MEPNEPNFRPLPLSILDLFAIFLPGLIWFLLLVTTVQLSYDLTASPISTLQHIVSFINGLNAPTLSFFALILVSILIGYILKPIAMRFAEWFSRIMFKFHKNTRKLKLSELKHPYTKLFDKEPYYELVVKIVSEKTGCPPEKLPGKPPFTAAKRYLRLTAPSLWEESERMEAEVRMTGTIFLAALYSTVLSFIVLVLQHLYALHKNNPETWVWLILSTLATISLAEGFNSLRHREVLYTYLNTLLAYGNDSTRYTK